ncbi:unnamed protein product [Meganyctiphanes norvegica]|uniref:cellulase n=1 Tax=Meganyctiphanes norvegica TaxID=48144 RepID=A0AAV2RB20_MEGNR
MAATTTLLAWGAIEYTSVYEKSGEMENVKKAVKWATDYFIKAHIAPNVLYGQVGDSDLDHSYWGRPEDMTLPRPAFKITTEMPGSDLAGETAAALAAASILFAESDAKYSDTCLEHAKQLYSFADKYRGNYSDSIPDAAKHYKSWSGYLDELAWASAWLYRATNNTFYLNASKTHFDSLNAHPNDFSWDDKTAGVQVLLSKLTKNETYLNMAKSFCENMIHNRPRTPKGLLFISKSGALRYAANSAYICLQIGNIRNTKPVYYEFSRKQIDYMLGDTGRSYVIGFGKNPPKRPNHRSSSCANAPVPCNWDTFNTHEPNANVLYGALVGGPDINDSYEDKRSNYISNRVSLDYNAAFQGTLAALMQYENC